MLFSDNVLYNKHMKRKYNSQFFICFRNTIKRSKNIKICIYVSTQIVKTKIARRHSVFKNTDFCTFVSNNMYKNYNHQKKMGKLISVTFNFCYKLLCSQAFYSFIFPLQVVNILLLLIFVLSISVDQVKHTLPFEKTNESNIWILHLLFQFFEINFKTIFL